MEERGRLQSMGLQRVGHDWATSQGIEALVTVVLAQVREDGGLSWGGGKEGEKWRHLSYILGV